MDSVRFQGYALSAHLFSFPPVPSISVLPTFETRITDADLPVGKGGYQCDFIKLSEMDNLFWIILCGVG